MGKQKLQWSNPGASTKARLVARPGVWRCTVGKQPARKQSTWQSYVRWAASPYLVGQVVAAPRHWNQPMCLQRKKVHGVLRGAVRSVSKRLAVHCIATLVLPLQRIFPQTMRPKQDRKLHSGLRQGQATRLSARLSACRPAQRPARHRGRHTAAPDALKTGHCKQKFTDFNVLPTQYDREKGFGASTKARRRPFRRATRPSVRQGIGGGTLPPPMHWKLGVASKHSQILPFCQHNTIEKKERRLCQGQAMRLSAHRPAQRAAARKTIHLSNFFGKKRLSPFTVEGRGPLHRLQRRVPLWARGTLAPKRGRFYPP